MQGLRGRPWSLHPLLGLVWCDLTGTMAEDAEGVYCGGVAAALVTPPATLTTLARCGYIAGYSFGLFLCVPLLFALIA